ncbi:hypothetical protein ABID95_005592 [Streptomyces atratus]
MIGHAVGFVPRGRSLRRELPRDWRWPGTGRSIRHPEFPAGSQGIPAYRGTALSKVDQHDTDIRLNDCLVTDGPGCLRVLAQPSGFGFLLFIAVVLTAGGIADLAS